VLEEELTVLSREVVKNVKSKDLKLGIDPAKGYKILHVATQLFSTGGHTRLLENYIEIDEENDHWLFLTKQEEEIPLRISQLEGGRIKKIYRPATPDIAGTARELNAIKDNFDVIVLHQHQHDATPMLALAASQGPPVIYMNHADHTFWLGASIADCCINFRPFAVKTSEQKRGIKNNCLLPIIINKESNGITRQRAKQLLNIPDDQVVFLTIASFKKYIPNDKHDFFEMATEVLKFDKNIHCYIVGVSENDDLSLLNYTGKNERIHLMGILEDPLLYEIAADYYLESMPSLSVTSIYETVKFGAYPFTIYAPNDLMRERVEFEGLIGNTENKEEYLKNIRTVLTAGKEANETITRKLSERIRFYNSTQYWKDNLRTLYAGLVNGTIKRQHTSIQEFNVDSIDVYQHDLFKERLKTRKLDQFRFVQKGYQ